jgi:hypothetical protein
MNNLTFITTDVSDTLPRMLDHARKSHFALLQLQVTWQGEGLHQVDATFGAEGAISFATLVELCRRMVEIDTLIPTRPVPPEAGGKVGPCLPH